MSAPPSGARRARRAGLTVVAVVTALIVLSSGVNALVPSRHGPPSSSYATTPAGLAAYAELLARTGHPVAQLRRPPAPGVLLPGQTVVLLDPDALLAGQGRALAAFVAAGGHLVTGGTTSSSFLAAILRRPPQWSSTAPVDAIPLGPEVPETAGVGRVVTLGQGGWAPGRPPAGLRPALGRPGRPPLLMIGRLGRGRIDLLADASPLQNGLLDRAGNARLGVDLAGADHRPVVFVESVHGYGPARGLAALPARWWWALGGLGLAAVAWVASRWPRLGPPSARGRTLPPTRSAYLQAMTTILRRTDAPVDIARIARSMARRLVVRRLGPGTPDVSTEPYQAAAVRLGLTPEEARVLAADDPPTDADLLTLGAALARLHGPRGPASTGRPG